MFMKKIRMFLLCMAVALTLTACLSDPVPTGTHSRPDATTTTTAKPTQPTFPTDPTEPPHVHQWEGATCTTPKTCTTCGETEGEPLEHAWDDGAVTKEPTEEAEGEKLFTCGTCGFARTESVPKLEHVHRYDAVVTAPTCTAGGFTTHTCSCGDHYTDSEVGPKGHAWDDGTVTKEPTEEAEGEKLFTCGTCGFTRTESVPKLEHVHRYDAVLTAPTCTAGGFTTHTCSCGDHYTDSEVEPKGHAWDDGTVTREPTEEAEGEKLFACTICGDTKKQILPTLNHEHHYEATLVAPTCVAAGYTLHTCRCGDSYMDTTVNARGHQWLNATCTVAKTCSVCHATEGTALGHTEVVDAAIAPSCTSTGLTEGSHCSVCGEVTVKQNHVGALGHEEIFQAAVAPTCTQTGLTEGRYCDRCKVTFVFQTTVPATGHSPVIDPAVAATCTTTGLTEGRHCSVCETVLTAQKIVSKRPHSEGNWIVDSQPTYTQTGSQHTACTVCGQTVSTQTIPAIFTFVLNADQKGYTLTSIGSCSDTEIVIPSTYCGLPVTAIGAAFKEHSTLTKVVIPDTVTEIGENAFRSCVKLKEINIPNRVTLIGYGAFAECMELTSIEIPDSVTSLGPWAFVSCYALRTVVLSKKLTTLDHTFYDCKQLEHITLHEGIISIDGAFNGCQSLKTIQLPASLEEIGMESFMLSGLTTITIPATVKKIESLAFSCSALVSVSIASENIGMGAFEACKNLAEVNLCDGVKVIGQYAFAGCDALTKIVLPDSITKLNAYIFERCENLKLCVFDGSGETWLKVNRDAFWFNSKLCDGYYAQGGKLWEDSFVLLTDPGYSYALNDDGNSYTWRGFRGRWHTDTIILPATYNGLPITVIRVSSFGSESFRRVFFEGTPEQWNAIEMQQDAAWMLAAQHVYFYSETKPTNGYQSWHYVDGLPVLWDHTHSYTPVVTSPTCATGGYTTYTCPCGDSYTADEVSAKGHQWIDATCVVPQTCVDCGATDGAAQGHSWAAATCTLPATCKKCSQTQGNALGHTEVVDAAVSATCLQSGLTEGRHCSVCKEVLVAQNTVAAKGHTEVVDAAVSATCLQSGLTEGRHCSVCKEVLVAQNTVAAKGHTEVVDAAVSATCLQSGLTEGRHCSVCKEVLLAQKPTNPLGHDWDEGTVTTEPQNNIPGEKTYACTRCDKVRTEVIPALNHVHQVVDVEGRKPTETTPGLTPGSTCTTCGTVIRAQVEIPTFAADYSGDYYYLQMGAKTKGTALQKLYDRVDMAVMTFHFAQQDAELVNWYNTDYYVACRVSFADLGLSENDAVQIWMAYKNDHPLYYWIDTTVMYTGSELMIMTIGDYALAADRKPINAQVYEQILQYLHPMQAETSAYQIALGFHDAIIYATDYAWDPETQLPEDELWAHSIVGLVQGRGVVCEGYARMFQLLLNAMDVENILVEGSAGNGGLEAHAWNLIRLEDGNWYWCDLTWDDDPAWYMGVQYQYFCVTDQQNTNWMDGGYVTGNTAFLQNHFPGVSVSGNPICDVSYPARSTKPFRDDSVEVLREKFTVGNFTYAVNGYATVQLISINYNEASNLHIPETVVYNGRTYTVNAIGYMDEAGIFGGVVETIMPDQFTAVYLPGTIRFLWDYAVNGAGVREYIVAEDNPYFTAKSGVLYTKSLYTLIAYPSSASYVERFAIPDETYAIAMGALRGLRGNFTEIRFGKNLKVIGLSNWAKGYPDQPADPCGSTVSGELQSLLLNWASAGKALRISVSLDNPHYLVVNDLLHERQKDGSVGKLICVANTELTELVIPQGAEIGEGAFAGCNKITHVTIPEGVTGIGRYAFFACTSLKSITIPESLAKIDASAFYACWELWHVLYKGNQTQWNSIEISSVQNDRFLNATRHYSCAGNEVTHGTVPVCNICNDKNTKSQPVLGCDFGVLWYNIPKEKV